MKNKSKPVAIPPFRMNGIAYVTFNTNGKPNTTGSEIPNKAGTKPNLATARSSSRLEKINSEITKDNTNPAPPTTIKETKEP